MNVCVVSVEKSGAVSEPDGLSDGGRPHPCDGIAAAVRHAPDDALLTPCLCQSVGVVQVGRPVAPMLIEVCPGGGLNGEAGGWHVVCLFACVYCRAQGGVAYP